MTTLHEATATEYCYSTDEEFFNHESIGELLEHIEDQTDTPIGATYFRGEKKSTLIAS